jgi:hypothetical protein
MFAFLRRRPAGSDERMVLTIDRLPRWLLKDLNLPSDPVGRDFLLPERIRARKLPRIPSF